MESGEQVCKAESLNIIPMQSQTLKGAELEEGREREGNTSQRKKNKRRGGRDLGEEGEDKRKGKERKRTTDFFK